MGFRGEVDQFREVSAQVTIKAQSTLNEEPMKNRHNHSLLKHALSLVIVAVPWIYYAFESQRAIAIAWVGIFLTGVVYLLHSTFNNPQK